MKKIVPVGLTSNVYQKVYSIIFLLHIYIILNTKLTKITNDAKRFF